jgi:hypothetical protein
VSREPSEVKGCLLYDLLPIMRDEWLAPLMQRFPQMLQGQPLFTNVLSRSEI